MIDILKATGYALICILGVLTHFLKKRITGESVADIKYYFRSHFRETLTMTISAVIMFIVLYQTDDLGVMSAFTAGYTADSMFNRIDK
jgi:hypothetical protein